jgi:indolepyruvate ferredoxin oxidoreductase alpha subunit
MQEILMGNEAVALGLIENGCNVISAYPGTPSSEVLPYADKLVRKYNLPVFVEWSVNEKVAFETVYANSVIGGKSAVIMKQVGLNVAMDSLMSAAYIGLKGAMVVVVADDPGPISSQTEQDSRFASMFAKLPVFDPCSPEEAREFAGEAVKLSEKYEIPVILRLTGRVAHCKTNIEFNPLSDIVYNEPRFEKNPLRWAAIPKFRYLQHVELNGKINEIANSYDFFRQIRYSENNKILIVTSGVCFGHLSDALDFLNIDFVDILKINVPYPVSKNVIDIISEYEKILVVEETYPVIEYQMGKGVYGRLTDDIPAEGELTVDKIINILVDFLSLNKNKKVSPVETKSKRPELCSGCPHRNSFYAIKKAFPKGIYPSDIGCYTLGLNMGAVDTCLCMGAAVNQAAGFYQGFKTAGTEIPPIIATIGDSTFFHSGVPGLINAVYQKAAFVLVVLDNSIVAMTGFQPTPEHGRLNSGKGNSVSIVELIKGCGIEKVTVVNPENLENMINVVKESWDFSIKNEKVSVVVAKAPCAILAKKEGKINRFNVKISDSCTGCKKCIKDFQCPAIFFNENKKKAEINYLLCIGCGVCTQVCKVGAIET